MSDNSASSASTDTAGTADPAGAADPSVTTNGAGSGDAGQVADGGKGSGGTSGPDREDPWDTFGFRGGGGLEKRAPKTPDRDQDSAG